MDSKSDPVDPFTGVWTLSPEDSRLTGRIPNRWIQTVVASDDDVTVGEEIAFNEGPSINSSVHARFDGAGWASLAAEPAIAVLNKYRLPFVHAKVRLR